MNEESGVRENGQRMGGLLIPACLFIGLGIGLAFGRPDVGVLVGLGAGFIGAALIRGREMQAPEWSAHLSWLFMVILGIVIIIGGIGLILFPAFIWPFVGVLFFLLLGVWFIMRGITGYRRRGPQ